MEDKLVFNLNSGSKVTIFKDHVIVDNFYRGGQADERIDNNNIDHVDLNYIEDKIFLLIYTKDGQIIDVLVNEDDLETTEVLYSYLINSNHYIVDFKEGKLILKKPYQKTSEKEAKQTNDIPVQPQTIIKPVSEVTQIQPVKEAVQIPFSIHKISWGTKLIHAAKTIFTINCIFIGIGILIAIIMAVNTSQYLPGNIVFLYVLGILAYGGFAVFTAWVLYIGLSAWGELIESKFIEREIALKLNQTTYTTRYEIQVK